MKYFAAAVVLLGVFVCRCSGAEPEPSVAEAKRRTAATAAQVVHKLERGYDASYVLRTTFDRDLPAWRVAAGKEDPAGLWLLGLCNYHGIGGAQNAPRGRQLIQRAAEFGDSEAMAVYSTILRNGNIDTAPDADAANEWLGKALMARSKIAADLLPVEAATELLVKGEDAAAVEAFEREAKAGNLNAMVALARVLRQGWLTELDLERSLRLLNDAAARGHIDAMAELGSVYCQGRYTRPQPAVGKRWYDTAAATGDAVAIFRAANAYEAGEIGDRPDRARANELWAKLRANGDPLSDFALFMRDEPKQKGQGPALDTLIREKLFRAATAGYTESYLWLGIYYRHGSGVTPKDLAKSLRYLEWGVAANNANVIFQMACAHRYGYYAPADEEKAVPLFFAAARLGVPQAMSSVGMRFLTGRGGVPRDPKMGFYAYLAAACAGDAEAMNAVAECSVDGVGTAMDLNDAERWALMATAHGYADAYGTLSRIRILRSGTGAVDAGNISLLERGAQAGAIQCMIKLGDCCLRGEGLARDTARGIALLERAAAGDERGFAQVHLGQHYLWGSLLPQDVSRATLYFNDAAARGNPDGWMGLAHVAEQASPPNGRRAVECLEKAVTLGGVSASYDLGRLYIEGRIVPKDVAVGVAHLRRAAAGGELRATVQLGSSLLFGYEGVPIAVDDGLDLLKLAADRGSGEACQKIALHYSNAKDYAAAMKWLERGIKLGDAGSFNDMGVLYRFGRGVPEDFAKAAQYYRRAVELGLHHAKINLAWCYETGNGVTQDKAEAFRLVAQAANATADPEAMFYLSRMYLDGIGTLRDQRAGFHWLSKAADAGHPLARQMLAAARAKGMVK